MNDGRRCKSDEFPRLGLQRARYFDMAKELANRMEHWPDTKEFMTLVMECRYALIHYQKF